jgi:hypothetical protein
MSLATLGGSGGPLLLPAPLSLFYDTASDLTVDGAGEYAVAIGQVLLSTGPGTSKVLSAAGGGSVFLRTGAITFANGGTTLRVGVQDQAATGLPDGTFDVFVDYVGGTDLITANSIHEFVMGSGTKTIADGDTICVGGRLEARAGSDSIALRGLSQSLLNPYGGLDTGGGAAQSNLVRPQATILFDDGTYGWLGMDVFAYIPTETAPFGSTSTPDEYALVFSVPFAATLRGVLVALHSIGSADDFEIVFYTSPLGTPVAAQTLTIDATLISTGNNLFLYRMFPSAISLVAGTTYAIAIRPTTTNTIVLKYLNFVTAALRTPAWFGTNWRMGTRTDQTGAFSETTTQVPGIGLYLSQLDDGVGAQHVSIQSPIVATPFRYGSYH